VRGLIRTSPFAGSALLLAALAIGGAPPFAVFLSEFSIVRAGLAQGDYLVTALLVGFITVAFCGIVLHVNRMVFGLPSEAAIPDRGHRALPVTCRLALISAAIPVVVLGVYQPASLHVLLARAA
jgi:hydrogenase-4 component F